VVLPPAFTPSSPRTLNPVLKCGTTHLQAIFPSAPSPLPRSSPPPLPPHLLLSLPTSSSPSSTSEQPNVTAPKALDSNASTAGQRFGEREALRAAEMTSFLTMVRAISCRRWTQVCAQSVSWCRAIDYRPSLSLPAHKVPRASHTIHPHNFT
jgi:hypothetical protein